MFNKPSRLDQLLLPLPPHGRQQERHVVQIPRLFGGQLRKHAPGRFVHVGMVRPVRLVPAAVEQEERRGVQDGVPEGPGRCARCFAAVVVDLRAARLRQQEQVGGRVDGA